MRAHREIIENAGGDHAVVAALGSSAGITTSRVRFWRRRNSIPAEWWESLSRAGVTTLEELAAGAAKRRSPEQSAEAA